MAYSELSIEQSTPLLGKPADRVLPRSLALWMAAIYVGLFIIRPWELLFPQLQAIQFERTYGICMVLCVAVTVGFRFQLTLQTMAVLLFTGAMAVCSVCAQDFDLAWKVYYSFLTLVVCYFVLISVIRSPYELLFIVGSYVGFMGLYLAKALWEYFVNGQHAYDQGVYRLGGIEVTFGHYNKLAASIVVSLPLWLFLWQLRAEIGAGWPKRWRTWLKRALGGYLALAVVSVVLTNSRTGMVAMAVFVILSGLRKVPLARLSRNVLLALVVIAIGWLILPEEHKNRVRTIWNPEAGPQNAEASKMGRVYAFRAAMEIYDSFPLLGVGPGNFGEYREEHVDGERVSPHNLLGQSLAETGLLGMGAFVLMVGVTLLNCRRIGLLSWASGDSTLRVLAGLAVACRNSILLLFVEGIAGHNLYRYNWLWLAAFAMLGAKFAERLAVSSDVDARGLHH